MIYLLSIAIAFVVLCGFIGLGALLDSYGKHIPTDQVDYDRIRTLELSIYGRTFPNPDSPWPGLTEAQAEVIEKAKREIRRRGTPVDDMAQEKWQANNPTWQDYTYEEGE